MKALAGNISLLLKARRSSFIAGAALAVCAAAVSAQTAHGGLDFERAGKPVAAEPMDKQIDAALKAVSTETIRANIEKLVSFNNRSTISSVETDLPPGTGVIAASEWIEAQFKAYSAACGGCLEVKVDDFVEQPPTGAAAARARIVKPTRLRNVYAILKGSDPTAAKRIYLVTGHYDTRETNIMETHSFAPGANDDSSGTAVSMEAARVLSKYKFPATLVFVCVAGEEQGLNGSRHLAQLAKKEGWQLEGVLNNDIVGGDTTPGDTLQSKTRVRVFSQGILPSTPAAEIAALVSLGLDNDSASRELAREVLDVDRTYFAKSAAVVKPGQMKPLLSVMELRLDRYLRGGDHSSFSNEGFAAVRFTEWRENFDHQHQHVRTENGIEYGDLLKFDDFNYIAQVARLNMATLATLADAPGIPQNVHIVTTNLDNNSTLKWEPPTATSGTVHYEIVWREMAATDWQYSTDATKYGYTAASGAATLPVSKDNVFFGVRACNAAGQCSQAVVPGPERRPAR